MFHSSISFVLFKILFLTFVNCFTLPSYFHQCDRKSSDFSQCLMENARNGVSKLAETGDTKWKINSLVPVKMKEIILQATPSLKVILNDAEYHGFDHFKINNISFANDKLQIFGFLDKLTLISKYDIKGRIMMLRFEGVGDLNVTLYNSTIKYTAKFKEEERKGQKYYAMIEDKAEMDPGFIHYKFDNLFGGDPQLGTEMNKLLNEFWREVYDEGKDAMGLTIASVYNIYVTAYFDKVPIKNLILN